jgi:hypothetical protein
MFLIVGTGLNHKTPGMRGRDFIQAECAIATRRQRRQQPPPFPVIGDAAHISGLPFALSNIRAVTGARTWRSQMTAIARRLSRAFVAASEIEVFKELVILCAAGLFVSLLMLTYGLDLSPGFF